MRVVSVVNQKGGVGKSTLAINIATVAEAKGDRVLLIDLDPQASSVLWGQTRGTNRPLVAATQPERLPSIISAAAEFGTTLVVIDAPSRLDPIALAAIRAADTIICPTMVDLINLAPLRETVALINSADKLEATIAVINNSDPASKRVEVAREELARLGLTVARTALMSSGQYAAAYDRGKGVIELGQGKASAQLHALWADLDKFAGRTVAAVKRNGKVTREVRT
jgi:chromosome partitioning protein